MTSKVSGMLSEQLHPVLQEHMLRPDLEREFPAVLPLIVQINKAHLLMLGAQGILSPDASKSLAAAILDLEAEGVDAFELDPAREESYFNYEAELIRRSGSAVGGVLHTARSRNDLYATMDRIRARALAGDVLGGLLDLRRALIERADAYADVLMPGYSHLQPAQPITYGYFLAGFAHALERDHARIAKCWARINVCPLGAGALAGTSFPIDREATARWLGFDAAGAHAQDDIAARDFLVELLNGVGLAAISWSRMAQDMFVMTTYEFGTLELPDSIAQTSSMMPQKKNMSALEVLRGSAAPVLGAQATAAAGLRSTHYSVGLDSLIEPFRWCWDALKGARRNIAVATLVVENARPRRERMMDLVRSSFATATELADMLVREAGLSFRDAHHVVGAVVRAALDRDLTADRIDAGLVAEAAERSLGRPVAIDPDRVAEALSPAQAVDARQGSGGPSRSDMERMLQGLRERHAADAAECEARLSSVRAADRAREAAFRDLAGR